MFTFELSENYLTAKEQGVFDDFLRARGLDSSIWEVFASLFRSATAYTRPLMLKAYHKESLQGAAVVIRCRKYGRSLFKNKLMARLVDMAGIPFCLWIKFGCGMDMMSNPGFARDPNEAEEMFRSMAAFLQKENILTVINDYSSNASQFLEASVLPALPHGLIDVSGMDSVEQYMAPYKNIKRKLKTFRNKGGEYHRVEKQLEKNMIEPLTNCFRVTAEKSVFYLPYQDLYLKAAQNTSETPIAKVHYFVAFLNGEFLGYQAALETGRYLNALHGAFDRNLKTTYHAYDILFVKMAEYAIENKLECVDFGAVVNQTKQKMVNKKLDLSYFIFSKNRLVQKIFNAFLKHTLIQGDEQLQYREDREINA